MAYEEDGCIRGYHLYQAIWIAVVGECLVCQREPLNSSHYMYNLQGILWKIFVMGSFI